MRARSSSKYLRILCLLAVVPFVHTAFAQNGPPAQPGTFQLLTTEPKAREVFSTDILPFIEAHRDDHQPRLVSVGHYSWVLILARDVIDQPDFQPLPEEIITVDEGTLEHWLLQWQ